MKPEDIDKLFRERLGDMPRTPSPEAWQRLQNQLQPPPKKKVIPMWWSIAATVAFLLLMGSYLYLNQLYRPAPANMARTEKPAEGLTRPDAGPALEQERAPDMVAEATPNEEPTPKSGPALSPQPEPANLIAGTRTRPAAPPATTGSARAASPGQDTRAGQTEDRSMAMMETPAMIALERPATRPTQVTAPAAAAPALETIEVVILKQEPAPFLADAGDPDEEAAEAGPSRKGKIVRGIFKQVKNIASGEKIDLSEVGLDNYTIALETQIGNRKISKKINF